VTKTRTAATATAVTAPSPASDAADDHGKVTLEEVQVSGKGYYFWFTHDTISAVTRRADRCP
jgi:hypothetical protein